MTKIRAATPARHMSAKTRALIRERSLKQGERRSAEITLAVETAMRDIEAEITANRGVYPRNDGALPFVEVLRRAGINSTTLYAKRYEELVKRVRAWLDKVARSTIGAVTDECKVEEATKRRRSTVERLANWRALYNGLLDSHRITELDLQECQREVHDLKDELSLAKAENHRLETLLHSMSSGKVLPMRTKRRAPR